MAKNRAEQATIGLLSIARGKHVVRVRDVADTWICPVETWDRAIARLSTCPVLDEDSHEGDAEAYRELCELTSAQCASINGTSRGDWRALVQQALDDGLLEPDDAAAFHSGSATSQTTS